jgi:hypothetical protein
MLFSVIKWTLISLTLIFLIHHLYSFLMNTLTVPKIKDLVNKPTEQYKDIFETLQKTNKNAGYGSNNNGNNVNNGSSSSNGNGNNNNTMTDELTQFFKDLKKTSDPVGEGNVGPADQGNSNAYSAY